MRLCVCAQEEGALQHVELFMWECPRLVRSYAPQGHESVGSGVSDPNLGYVAISEVKGLSGERAWRGICEMGNMCPYGHGTEKRSERDGQGA